MAIDIAHAQSDISVDWTAIDTVLLDMDGTLLDLSFDNDFWNHRIVNEYAARNRLDRSVARTKLAPVFLREQGSLNWYCLDFWRTELGFDVGKLKRTFAHQIAWRRTARTFLEHLRGTQCDVVLVTNAHPETLQIKLEQINLSPWFDAIYTSHEFGAAKESQTFWHRLAQQHTFDRTRTLFIDDSEVVLAAAEDYGIEHLFTLRQPDSTQPPREVTQYPAIDGFDDMFRGPEAKG